MRRDTLSWNLYSAVVMLLFCFFQIMQWPLLPKFLDIYYHLFVMKAFDLAGGYVTYSFWEYAPVGRPHLYPPLFHFLLLGLYKLGLNEITIARLVDATIYPAFLCVQWLVLRRLFTPRVAFYTTLLFSSVYSLHLATVILAPFSLAMLSGLFLFVSFHAKKTLQAGLLLGFCFYTHSWVGWIFSLAVLLAGVLEKRNLKSAVWVVGLGILIASPFLAFQYAHRAYFQFVNPKENLLLEIDVVIYALAFIGLGMALRKKGASLLAVSLAFAMIPFALTHRYRFFSGHGLIGWVWLAGLTCDSIHERLSRGPRGEAAPKALSWLIFIAGFFYLVSPVLFLDLQKKSGTVVYFDRSVSQYLKTREQQNFRARGFTIYFENEYRLIAKIVNEHTSEHDILWSNFNHGGGLIALLSDRFTSSAMMQEVKPFKPFDEKKAAKLLIWFKEPTGEIPAGMQEAVGKYGLRRVAETDFVYVYENPEVLLEV